MKPKIIFAIALFISWAFLAVLFAAFLLSSQNDIPPISNISSITANLSLNQSFSLTIEEISRHNSQSDCWTLINNKVYDVTSYFSSHPGGAGELLKACGIDATVFYTGGSTHSSSTAASVLSSFYIGDLNQELTSSEIIAKTNTAKNTTISGYYDDDYEDDD